MAPIRDAMIDLRSSLRNTHGRSRLPTTQQTNKKDEEMSQLDLAGSDDHYQEYNMGQAKRISSLSLFHMLILGQFMHPHPSIYIQCIIQLLHISAVVIESCLPTNYNESIHALYKSACKPLFNFNGRDSIISKKLRHISHLIKTKSQNLFDTNCRRSVH